VLQVVFLLSAGTLAFFAMTRPHLLLRPSLWFAFIMITRINAAASFADPSIDEGFRAGYTLRLLSILFPFGIFVWILATPAFSRLAADLADRCRVDVALSPEHEPIYTVQLRVLFIFLALSALIMLVYFSSVPLKSTGLFVLITDPINSTIAREESLKLVTSPVAAYTYMWHTVSLAPVLMGLLVQFRGRLVSVRNLLRVVAVILIFGSVMITGARAPGGRLFLLIGLVILLRKGPTRGVVSLLPAAALALALAAFISILRQDELAMLNANRLFETISNAIFRRTFVTPYVTGVWFNHLAQDYGNFGVGAIHPLAKLFHVPFIDVANISGLAFTQSSLSTTNATTCFLFGFQASFGLFAGWVISLLLLCALDLVLPVFVELRGPLLSSFLAAFLMANTVLVGSSFTTALISHGILPVAFLAYVCGKYTTQMIQTYAPPSRTPGESRTTPVT
jgi:hypothetical protein